MYFQQSNRISLSLPPLHSPNLLRRVEGPSRADLGTAGGRRNQRIKSWNDPQGSSIPTPCNAGIFHHLRGFGNVFECIWFIQSSSNTTYSDRSETSEQSHLTILMVIKLASTCEHRETARIINRKYAICGNCKVNPQNESFKSFE